MLKIPGLEKIRVISETDHHLIYRGIDSNNTSLLCKTLKNQYRNSQLANRLRLEYEIGGIINSELTVQMYEWLLIDEAPAFLMEDFDGIPLSRIEGFRDYPFEDLIKIAILITSALSDMHQKGVAFCNLSPRNILYNPMTRRMKLTNFSQAIHINVAHPHKNLPIPPHALPYISPEQTGRLSRNIDHRSDFYSLGILLYKFFSGSLPFAANSYAEFIHHHIAKEAPPAHLVNREIPRMISMIIQKLMEKSVESRYQSCKGVLHDFQLCLESLSASSTIKDFSPGQKDIAEVFQIPEKLYGRDKEINRILNELNRSFSGETNFLLVTGPSGIGKTSLINGLRKPVAQLRGHFLAGKFDQIPSEIPCLPIIQAFQGFINQVFADGDRAVSRLRQRILSHTETNISFLAQFIPELELIFGKQKNEDNFQEAQYHRFLKALSQFTLACTTEESPLILFLDDMQWADTGTLKFIEHFLTSHPSSGIMILGTFRDNEVNESHPLLLIISRISQTSKQVPILKLPPLNHDNVQNLVAETLFESRDSISSLARICHDKTHGNPFFLKQFLLAAHFEKHITYDPHSGRWLWDERAIHAMETTENLLPLQERKLKTFNKNTLKTLKYASCLGNSFSLKTLATVCMESEETVLNSLEKLSDIIIGVHGTIPLSAAQEELEDDHLPVYKFAHDRLQRAVYSLLSTEEIKAYHYQIGVQLKKGEAHLSEYPKVFDITGHLNIGADQIKNLGEKLELARMNLEAGKKALSSSANYSAHNYLQAGLQMLPDDSWKTEYSLTLSIHTHAAEAAYLCKNFERCEDLFEIIERNGKSLLDKVSAYSIQIRALKARNLSEQAVDTGISVLRKFGVRLPRKPGKARAFLTFLRIKDILSSKKKKDILNIPQLKNEKAAAALKILADIATAAYYTNSSLFPYISHRAIKLSLKHGNSYDSILMGYAVYGFLECSLPLGDIERGYTYAKLSLELQENLGGVTAENLYFISSMTRHWKEPMAKILVDMEKIYTGCLETGNYEIAAISLFSCTFRYLFQGTNLDDVEEKIRPFRQYLDRLGHVTPQYRFLIFQQLVENLRLKPSQSTLLAGKYYSEDNYTSLHVQAGDFSTLFIAYFARLMQNYTFNNYREALSNLENAEKYEDNVTGSLFIPYFSFYAALTYCAAFRNGTGGTRFTLQRKIAGLVKKLKRWATHCPENFLHKYYIVMGEICRNNESRDEALHYFDQAMLEAEKNDYIQDLALSHELTATYLFSLNRYQTATLHLVKANKCYLRWGAQAKVKQLTGRFESFLPEKTPQEEVGPHLPSAPASSQLGSSIDVESMIKATKLLTGTIVESDLLRNLLVTMIENAGAQRGFLLFRKKEGWQVRLQGNLQDVGVKISTTQHHKTRKHLCLNIVNYVALTKESVVLGNATGEGLFMQDPYVLKNTPKSILCIPLIHQDKISCIVYLENNLTFGAFSKDRQDILHMLGSHAAITLKNSSLYGELEETIEKLHLEIKKRKDTQLQLLHAEKLTALGRLSASIAHEFGNPLIGIQYLLQDILGRFSLTLDDEKLIHIGVEECERMKILIRDMQQLNKPSSGKKKLFNPHKAIENVLLFQKKNLSNHGISVVREFCSNYTFIHAVEDQVTQVLVNITLNAVDAMAEKGGVLTVVTNQDSEYMDIIIKDTGNGIKEDDQKNIFEPFFSTKAEVEGTGLGLPVSYSIVKNHGGTITFKSKPGKGSTFHIRLPNKVSELN